MRKRNNSATKAILGLAAASVVVIGASVAISLTNGDEPVNQTTPSIAPTGPVDDDNNGKDNVDYTDLGGEALDLAGASSKIVAAARNEDGTYTLVVAEEGYIGTMKLKINYSADGKTVLGYDVVESEETPNIGTKVNEDAYKTLLAGTVLPMYANGMDISAIVGTAQEDNTEAVSADWKDGVYKVEATPDEKGNYAFVTVTIKDGKIASVVWDEVYNGGLKSELSTTGQYVMKPVWDTQAKSMCQYVVDNQGTAGLNLNEAGKTDVVSGVSINVTGFTALIDELIAEANGKDGVYKKEATPDEKGNYPFVSITVEGGKIVAATWDEVYNGGLKSELSTTGKYVMKPVWNTQAESMGAYVVENQTTAGLNLDEKGKTDVVSGVSINVLGFVDLVNQAIAQASTTLQDGVYKKEATPDDKGNYAFVTVTVEGGKITSVVWDEVYNGGLKSELSTTGQYVMKPVWDTQAKSMCQYVVDNQGTAGLNLNEAGKTDVVSGVSINVTGFTALIDELIAEANGKDGVYKKEATPDEKGNYPFVSITVEGGKIVAATWDEVYNGGLKSELSTTGKYVMKPVWNTQAESMGAYVVENQTTAGLNLDEKGKTDVVSGVSINVLGFVDLVNEALAEASVTGEIPELQKPDIDATLVDVVSGATFSSRAVIRAINEGYVFLRDNVIK